MQNDYPQLRGFFKTENQYVKFDYISDISITSQGISIYINGVEAKLLQLQSQECIDRFFKEFTRYQGISVINESI